MKKILIVQSAGIGEMKRLFKKQFPKHVFFFAETFVNALNLVKAFQSQNEKQFDIVISSDKFQDQIFDLPEDYTADNGQVYMKNANNLAKFIKEINNEISVCSYSRSQPQQTEYLDAIYHNNNANHDDTKDELDDVLRHL